MSQNSQIEARTIELAKISETEEDIFLLQKHVKEVIEGAAFKGSHRSGQFLQYIVDQAIAGHFESLKERVIGIELFGRAPSYDTGDDAIVRVTASDVRKRLLQHYGRYGGISEFRISLPLGSYFPEISRDPLPEVSPASVGGTHQASEDAQHHIVTPQSEVAIIPPEPAVAASIIAHTETHETSKQGGHRWLVICLVLTLVNVALWGVFWNHFTHKAGPAASVLPWSVFLTTPRALHLIISDPDMAEIQGYTRQQLSVSDYANHNYIPPPDKLTPEIYRICQLLLRGNKTSLVDTPIAVNVAELAQSGAKRIELQTARSVQLSNLQTDDNFILLGSPLSNPWTAFFSDQLDFRFVFDKDSGQEIVRNVHPREHEQTQYVPTALGWATGQSYAIVALVRNPDQNGQVLLIGGANAEGTEAAGKLVTDLPRLSNVLQSCGIPPSGPLQHFELLLRLNMMAGSPTNTNVEACHILPGTSIH
jgi:hypothetical protein